MLKGLLSKHYYKYILFFLLVLFVFYLYKDFNLSMKKIDIVPDVVVNNMKMTRYIDGDRWDFKSPKVEHKNGEMFATSLDLTISTKDNKKVYVLANNAIYNKATSNLELMFSKTRLEEQDKTYYLSADYTNYNDNEKVWRFKDNLSISTKNIIATSMLGEYNMISGICILSKDAVITWDKE
ncbi:MAG: LPS export ABC transporter periplasmic protein LptC [Synergistaceae bacterium]